MTSNPIYDAIIHYEESGRLFKYTHSFGKPLVEKRLIYFTEQGIKQCPPSERPRERELNGTAITMTRAHIASFIRGDELFNNDDFKYLENRDADINYVWALRPNGAKEDQKTRLFGFFPCKDIFIVIHCKMRKNLGRNWDHETWENAILKVHKTRLRHFLRLEPIIGDNLSKCVSNVIT